MYRKQNLKKETTIIYKKAKYPRSQVDERLVTRL